VSRSGRLAAVALAVLLSISALVVVASGSAQAVSTGTADPVALPSLTAERRLAVDFTQPFASLRRRTGTYPVVVVCFDPRRPGVPAPTLDLLRGVHQGTDGGRNVTDWFVENSGDRLRPGSPRYVGCNDSGWLAPPAGREGTWYWDTGNFPLMWQDALLAADPFIDFHAYDTNRDGHLSGDEVVVEIVRPENGSGGFVRTASAPLDGQGTLTIDIMDAYLSSFNDTGNRNLTVGLVAHEAAHLTLGAADMYANLTTRANTYSIMDWHGDHTHLDPFHKLKSGFTTPNLVEINSWSTRTVTMAAVETTQEITIVYDAVKADQEYYILENRWGGSGSGNYDRLLPAEGIVVWHIIQDFALMDAFPPPGDPVASGDWGRKGIRKLAVLSATDRSQTLTWADGSSAGIRVTTKAGPQQRLSTEIAKL
jgi:M6 family metalloprotease-like protein